MKKIIILIAILCSFGFCRAEIDYNKVLPQLGYNCEIEKSMSEFRKKTFFCDSGYIIFDFKSEEIFVEYNGLPKNGHKRTVNTLFNRGWYNNTNQSHKEKSVIMFIKDEFGEVIVGGEERWNGNFYDFYERFKEDVYYVENTTEETSPNNEDEKIETKQQTYEEWRIAQIMEKYK